MAKKRNFTAEVAELEQKLFDLKQEAREAMNREAWAKTATKPLPMLRRSPS